VLVQLYQNAVTFWVYIKAGIKNSVLLKKKHIFGPKRNEVTGEWRKLHNEELHDLYSSPNIVRVITSRRIIWAGHVA
jgi:hypothetical protein